jgi:hypothetical protein
MMDDCLFHDHANAAQRQAHQPPPVTGKAR